MKIDPVPEGLDGRDDAGRKRAPGHNLEISGQGPKGQAAEIPQQLTLVLEEDPQRLGYGEDDLTMGHVQKERLPLLTPRVSKIFRKEKRGCIDSSFLNMIQYIIFERLIFRIFSARSAECHSQ